MKKKQRKPPADKLIFKVMKNGDISAVCSLLPKIKDVNAFLSRGSHPTLLHIAAKLGNKSAAEILIANGADVNRKDYRGQTPLHTAIVYRQYQVAELFIAKGTNVNIQDLDGWTALHLATLAGNQEIIKLLLENGADVNRRTNEGWTALDWAKWVKEKGKEDTTSLLSSK